MKGKIYINGISSISAQPEDALFGGEIISYHKNILPAVPQNFKKLIPAMALRRMSTGIKMGITAAKMALQEAKVETPDAIITGTGQGCKQDTEKFLKTVLDQKEEMLSPTAFIQSTHNTVGGQIALNLNCTAYNMTYTQNSASLESAFLDAMLQLKEVASIKNILVGGVDEISEKITSFQNLDGQLKQEQILNLTLLGSNSPGTITSEGAHFFSLSNKKTLDTYAEFIDVDIFKAKDSVEVSERILSILKANLIYEENIDLVILGKNGDNRNDHFYEDLQDQLFNQKPQLAYKHLVGDFDTVTGYAVWLACRILKEKSIPEILKLNSIERGEPGKILIYNQYLGENHSIILLGKA